MLSIHEIVNSPNLVDKLDEFELHKISDQVSRGYKLDYSSCDDWRSIMQRSLIIAKQLKEHKTFPWEGASDIKYPLVLQAVIASASRHLPEFIKDDKVVQIEITGDDPNLDFENQGKRCAAMMNWQLLVESPDWVVGTDKLFHEVALLGTVFKKTYYNEITERICSEVCLPDRVVVNYYTDSLDNAPRITHVLDFSHNDLVERMRSGLFAEVDFKKLQQISDKLDELDPYKESGKFATTNVDDDFTYRCLEQHCYYDLDGDGYQEPYIVTIHEDTQTVLRIVHRIKHVALNQDGKIKRIDHDQYFTDFHYMPSPDGAFYSIGLGMALTPMNETINTLYNQLVDAGTLSNQQAGFVGAGLRLKNGSFKLKMGEWQVIGGPGTDLRQQIMPLPTKEPSSVLFQLIGALLEGCKELAAITEINQGTQAAQNVPASTIMMLAENGMKVFTGITKRLFWAFQSEFRKIFGLNGQYLDNDKYVKVLNNPLANVKHDFNSGSITNVAPVADPNLSSMAQRLARAQALAGVPGIDPQAASEFVLNALGLSDSDIKRLLPPKDPNAPPPPEVQEIMAKTDLANAQAQLAMMQAQQLGNQAQMNQMELQLKAMKQQLDQQVGAAQVAQMQMKGEHDQIKLQLNAAKISDKNQLDTFGAVHSATMDRAEHTLKTIDTATKVVKGKADMVKADAAMIAANKPKGS